MAEKTTNMPYHEAFDDLTKRLQEAEETLEAIRKGHVDAVVVDGPQGQQVYTLENADRPYRLLIEQMQEGAVTLSDNGTVLYCNARFADLVGSQRETLIGTNVTMLMGTAEAGEFLGLLVHGRGKARAAEFNLRTGAALDVPVNISLVDLAVEPGMPRIVCVIVTDLTHSRQRSHELAAANDRLASEIDERRRAEDSLELALDAADMGSWTIDLATQLTHSSSRFSSIFGRADSTALDFDAMLEQFLPDDRHLVAQAFARAPHDGFIDFEKRMKRDSDGVLRWVRIKGRTYYENDNPVRLAGVVSDVTDQRLVEDQLRQAQKMEAIGQLTGGIAHDFNNLLMVIGGNLDLLQDRVPADERSQRHLKSARHGVQRGATLNQQLLAFSRRQDLRVQAVSIDELITSFETLLDRAVGETVTIDIQRSAELWYCRTDPHQLETAILNLAINSRDAMPQGGKLTLSTSQRHFGIREAAIWGANGGDYVAVVVADTGTGMLPDVLARAFEPFFTTKAVGEGTGLGLSQVYGFAKQSGGFVVIESELQQGTTISIYLPRAEAPDTAALHGHTKIEVKGQGTVLLVEDDGDVRAVTSSMLRDLGYAVVEATCSREALALIDCQTPLDLVFTDVIMPGDMNGIDLAHTLRQRFPTLPVLLTSGYTAQRFVADDRLQGLELLRKPYTQVELSIAIQDAMIGT